MTKILVTGGAGYLGSHTCLALVEKGYKVIAIDSFINSKPESLERVNNIYINSSVEKIKVIKGDLRNLEDLRRLFFEENTQGEAINGVIHFAGLKAVNESIRNPLIYWENNIISSINLFKVMNENRCKNIVFSSSATVYGLSNKYNISENSPLNALDNYGFSKILSEEIINSNLNKIAKIYHFRAPGIIGRGAFEASGNFISSLIYKMKKLNLHLRLLVMKKLIKI